MTLLTTSWDADLLILISTIIIIYFLLVQNFQYWKKRGVMQINPKLLFGNFARCCFMKMSPGLLLKEFYEKSEGFRYMGFYVFNKPCFLLRDPDLIKQILLRDFNIFADKYMEAGKSDHLGNSSIFLVKNPQWKILRSKMTPVFSSGKLKNMFELMLEVGNDLDYHLDSLKDNGTGSLVEIKELCAKFTTDLIGTTAYGLKVNSLNNPEAEFRKFGKKMFSYNLYRSIELTCIFIVPQFARFFNFKFFGGNDDFLKNVFSDTLNERVKSGMKRRDLIDILIELKNKYANEEDSSEFKFEGDMLLGQAAIFFTGGFETSSTTMSFALYELARHSEIQEKLRSEINDRIEKNEGKITYDLVNSLQYLDMVVSETLRMYPILPIIDRVAMSDYKIPETNLIIEKGTPVFIPLLGLHYDPKYFSNPESFDPEHFSKENKSLRHSFVHLPFSEGPRNCIGKRFGLLQTKLGIIRMISRFEITTCKETSMEIDPRAFLTTVKREIILNFRKINK